MSSQASTAWLQLWNWTSLPSQEISERVLKGYQGLLFTPICPGEKRGQVAGDKPGDCQWRSFSCACGWSVHCVPPSFHYYLEQSLPIAWTAVYELSEDRKALNQQGSSQSYGLISMRSSWALMFNSYPIKDQKEWMLLCVIISVTFVPQPSLNHLLVGAVKMLLWHWVLVSKKGC